MCEVALLPERVPHPDAGRRSECQLRFFVFARGLRTSLPMVAPLLESCRREVELGAGASPRCEKSLRIPTSFLLFACGLRTCGPRSVLVAPILERCQRGVGLERVPNPAARGRATFVSSGSGVVGRSHCLLRCSTRSNNTFHSLFYPKCLQVPPRTPMDTPTPDKDLCNAKRKLKCIIPNLNDQNMQE